MVEMEAVQATRQEMLDALTGTYTMVAVKDGHVTQDGYFSATLEYTDQNRHTHTCSFVSCDPAENSSVDRVAALRFNAGGVLELDDMKGHLGGDALIAAIHANCTKLTCFASSAAEMMYVVAGAARDVLDDGRFET